MLRSGLRNEMSTEELSSRVRSVILRYRLRVLILAAMFISKRMTSLVSISVLFSLKPHLPLRVWLIALMCSITLMAGV